MPVLQKADPFEPVTCARRSAERLAYFRAGSLTDVFGPDHSVGSDHDTRANELAESGHAGKNISS